MFNFGAGRARLIPAGGGQPVELGVVQSATVDLKVDLKELRGAFRYPIAVADGRGTASGKVSFMQLWPQTLATIMGGTLTNGAGPTAALNEAGTIPSMTTYTVTLANAATMVAGSEIVLVNIGTETVFYTRVASAPAAATVASPTTGSYTIAAGVLTFNMGDASRAIQTTYLYTPATNTGTSTVALQQVGMNTALTFQLTLIGTGKNIYNNAAQQFIVNFNTCLAPSLSLNFKLDDYTDLSLDFQAFIDANGNLGSFYMVNPT